MEAMHQIHQPPVMRRVSKERDRMLLLADKVPEEKRPAHVADVIGPVELVTLVGGKYFQVQVLTTPSHLHSPSV